MDNFRISCISLVTLVGIFSATAWADGDAPPAPAVEPDCATLVNPVGRVLVNQGDEYVIGGNGMPVGIGDRVVTMDASSVTVAFITSAAIDLPENSQLLIDQCDAAAAPLVADAGPAPIPVAAPVNYLPLLPLAAIPLVYLALDDDDDDDDDRSRSPE